MYKTTINYKNDESRVIESKLRIVAYGMMEDSNLIELGTENGIDYLVNIDELIDIRFNEQVEEPKTIIQNISINVENAKTPKEAAILIKEAATKGFSDI